MKPRSVSRNLLSLMVLAASSELQAANFTWDPSQTPVTPSGGTGAWNLSDTFWSNGATDVAWADTNGLLDTATFGGSAGTVTLGTNLGAKGLVFGTTGYTITGYTITGSTLTLGVSGIDASALSSGTTTISSNVALASGNQAWNVGSGATLALNTGTFTRSTGATLNLSGAGTVSSSMTGIANDASGIVGPWLTVGTGSATTYAQLSGGNLVAYTGGTSGASTAIPSASTSANNYTITTAGTGAYGVNRTLNTLRNTVGASTITMGNSTGQINLTINGILNSGTGTLTIAQGGTNTSSGLMIGANNGRELVLNAANAQIAISGRIINNTGGASSVTVTGPNAVTFGGTNTFTGDLTVNGTLNAGAGQGATPTASNLGALQPAANRNIIVNSGGTLALTGGNVLGTGGSTNTLSNTTLVVNSGGVFQTGLNGAGAGWWNKIGATTLNGGTIHVGSGANNGVFQGLALIGNVTVAGTSASTIDNYVASNSTTNGIHLGQNAGAGQIITFDVANVTGSSASDLNISAKLLNTSATLTASGLTKSGAGTMTLTGANAYTGATTISGGTLQIGDGGTAGSLAGGSAITNDAALVFNRSDALAQSNAISGSGTVTKLGGGTLTLSGASNYSGATTVSNGRLTLTGSLTSAITAGSGTTLGGTGSTTGLLTMNGGSILSLDGTSTSVSLTSNGVTFAGATALTFDSAPVAGTYDVIKYGAGGVSGLGNLSSATIRAILNNDTFNQKVTAAVSTGTRTWDTTDGTWEYGGANTDWQEGDQQFFAGDSVVFGNPAAASAITLTGLLTPASVSVNNTNSYTFAGSGSIVGATSLTKSGVGALTINNANTFTGGTTLTAGTLTIGNAGALGAGSVALNGGTLNVNGNTISNAISLSGGEVSGSGTLSGVISGAAGVLTKSGAGTLTLTTANNYGGGTSITNGELTLTGAGSLGAGAVSIVGGTTLNFSGNPYTLANTVTGAGSINSGVSNTVTGDFSGFTGTFTHSTTTASSSFNSAAATSKDAAYVIATVQGSSQGMIAGGSGDYTLELGSLSGVANSLFRGGNVATGTTTLQVGNLDADTNFAGSIANGATKILAFTKVGAGIQTLSGASTYTGATTVSAGTLLVNGSLGNTAVTVESDAALGGSNGVIGLTSASITVAAGGTLAPGASAGTLTVNGNVTIDGVFAYEYDGATTSADLLDVNGTLTLNSATLTLADLFGNSYNMGDKFTLAAYDTLSGTFSGYTDDTAYVFGGGEWLINYNDATAGLNGGTGTSYITMTAIPEPAAALIGGLGLLALLRRRRD